MDVTEPIKSQDKYKKWKGWKWFLKFYLAALTCEILVSLYFWSVLWEQMKDTKRKTGLLIEIIGLALNHSLPLFLVLVDFVFFNAIPFAFRHMIFIVVVSVVYLSINFLWTKNFGPVYPDMTWSDPKGIILPFVLVLIATVGYLFLHVLTRIKFSLLGLDFFKQLAVVPEQ